MLAIGFGSVKRLAEANLTYGLAAAKRLARGGTVTLANCFALWLRQSRFTSR